MALASASALALASASAVFFSASASRAFLLVSVCVVGCGLADAGTADLSVGAVVDWVFSSAPVVFAKSGEAVVV